MKKGLILGVAIMLVAGCMTVKTYTVEKPRIDTDIEGNRGFLVGSAQDEPYQNKFGDTRKISVFEVELGASKPAPEVRQRRQADVEELEAVKDVDFYGDYEEVAYIEEIEVKEPGEDFQYYVVNKNDTLQKISTKFYGTTRKWKFLYNVNKDVIKHPDKVFPGIKIKIPVLD